MKENLPHYVYTENYLIFCTWTTTSVVCLSCSILCVKPQFFKNGRQPQCFQKWKTTSIVSKMEDDINYFQKWKTTPIFSKIEEYLNLFEKGRQPQLFSDLLGLEGQQKSLFETKRFLIVTIFPIS
jgi:hypothetical protein